MKTFRFLTLIFLSVLVISCKKDEPKDLILGDWKGSKIVNTGCNNPENNQNLTMTDGCYTEATLGLQLCLSISFKNDGSYIVTTKTVLLGTPTTETETGTYTINGGKLKLCPSGSACEEGDFSVSDKTLILKSKDSDTGCNSEATFVK